MYGFKLQTDTVRHRLGLVHSPPHSGDVYFSTVLGHPSPSTATGEHAVTPSAWPVFPLFESSFPERLLTASSSKCLSCTSRSCLSGGPS